jgi:metal transporter CNNM
MNQESNYFPQISIPAGVDPSQDDKYYKHDAEHYSSYDYSLLFNIIGATICILFVGLLSSMFLGLLTLDPLDLKVKQRAAIGEDEEYANKLLPVVEQYHRLLVTLLLLNALAYEALPLFLDNLLPTWATICLSVTFLLIFGEIIPSAIFTGPDQLRLASSLVPLVRCLLVVMYPFAVPLAKLLDYLVPEDPNEVRYHRGELSALVRIQYEQREAHRYKQQQQQQQQQHQQQRGQRGHHHYQQQQQQQQQQQGQQGHEQQQDQQERGHQQRGKKGWNKSKTNARRLNKKKGCVGFGFGLGLGGRGRDDHDDADHEDGDDDDISSGSSSSSSICSSIGVSPTNNKTIKRSFYKSNATWRNFKREILEAVRERVQSATTTNTDSGITEEDLESLARNVRLNLLPPPLESTEIQVVQGALNMKTRVAMDVYTPIRNMFAVPSDMILNKANMTKIYANGYSRVPVYEAASEDSTDATFEYADLCHVKGVLMTRQLILIDWDDERKVGTLPIQTPPCVSPRMNLVDLLHLLQNGGSLMAFVCARPDVATKAMEEGRAIPSEGGFMGLVTLEDVLESIIQETILDEIDMTHRTLASARLTHWAATVLQRFVKKKRRGEKVKRDSQHDHAPGGIAIENGGQDDVQKDGSSAISSPPAAPKALSSSSVAAAAAAAATTTTTTATRVTEEDEIDLEVASESTALLNGNASNNMTFSSV